MTANRGGCRCAEEACAGRLGPRLQAGKEERVLWTIAVVLFVLWALGLVSSYTMGGFVHILLVLAVVVILVRVIQGRSVL